MSGEIGTILFPLISVLSSAVLILPGLFYLFPFVALFLFFHPEPSAVPQPPSSVTPSPSVIARSLSPSVIASEAKQSHKETSAIFGLPAFYTTASSAFSHAFPLEGKASARTGTLLYASPLGGEAAPRAGEGFILNGLNGYCFNYPIASPQTLIASYTGSRAPPAVIQISAMLKALGWRAPPVRWTR